MVGGIAFQVPGVAQTKGSARAYTRRRRDGGVGVGVTNDNPRAKSWASIVAFHARAAAVAHGWELAPAGVWVGLAVVVVFERPRVRWRDHHTVRPDLDKVLRCLGDALTGVLWADDSQVVAVTISKRYADAGERAHSEITAWRGES